MLTLIHGLDTANSRKYFLDQKQQYADALLLDGDKVNLTDLAQIFEGGGLFGESKYIFIEQLVTKKKKASDFKDIIEYLENHAEEHTIVLWENKELDIGTTKTFKKALIRPFKLPQTLFILLDSIKPGNGSTLVSLFHQTIESAETEMVFFMLIRQFRLLLGLAESGVSEIDELKRMAPWQRTKMQKQAAQFTKEELLAIYNQLYAIERGQKTGGLATGIIPTIDFLLLDI